MDAVLTSSRTNVRHFCNGSLENVLQEAGRRMLQLSDRHSGAAVVGLLPGQREEVLLVLYEGLLVLLTVGAQLGVRPPRPMLAPAKAFEQPLKTPAIAEQQHAGQRQQ